LPAGRQCMSVLASVVHATLAFGNEIFGILICTAMYSSSEATMFPSCVHACHGALLLCTGVVLSVWYLYHSQAVVCSWNVSS